ncbi:hypothetical protein HMPREF3086_08405 [Dietzia sp. HMSC21D01]|uniref:TM2 domain-containing protein n=1 Tax=Dietzia cinnamea TaxID=321318 RepID=A0AAW5Q8Z4_9ACTN|nr:MULTISPECIES: hypothetical protein [Dietzia]MCT1863931.1 hypothetical protein [Dietzia cinnamea]MCT2028993.1 hypothetical protein [Dietzia cinnamea]MCT2033548.1 hypothetical protein [Dietzia cinnamea]MCT2058200.1 hypothetical protein [Dietzia cinnamea]MCT2075818.1 hypothetical protein [Dietzia cinnamea]
MSTPADGTASDRPDDRSGDRDFEKRYDTWAQQEGIRGYPGSDFGDTAFRDSAFGDTAFGDTAFGDTAFGDPASGGAGYGDPQYGAGQFDPAQHGAQPGHGTQPYAQPYARPSDMQQYGMPQYGHPGQPHAQPYGAMQPYGQYPPATRKDPALMLVASLLIPGLGTMLNGRVGRGVGILAGYGVGVLLSVVLIGLPIMFGFWVWGMVDAYQGAKDHNARHGLP